MGEKPSILDRLAADAAWLEQRGIILSSLRDGRRVIKDLLEVLETARGALADLADDFVRSNSLLDADLNPVPGTMDADAQAIAEAEQALLEAIDAAIAKAEG